MLMEEVILTACMCTPYAICHSRGQMETMHNPPRAWPHVDVRRRGVLCVLSAAALVLSVASSAWSGINPELDDEPFEEEERFRPEGPELILMLMQRDMMYGTDDWFGENSDLSRADGVVPTQPGDPQPVVADEPDRRRRSGGDDGEDDEAGGEDEDDDAGDDDDDAGGGDGDDGGPI